MGCYFVFNRIKTKHFKQGKDYILILNQATINYYYELKTLDEKDLILFFAEGDLREAEH